MNTNTDKAFPQNTEAEESLLSAILHDNNILDDVLSIINSEDFYNHKSQKIFNAMIALFQTGEPIDLITLSDNLAKNGSIKQVGGAYALSRLVDQVPLAVNPVHYAKIVKEKSILRKLIFKSKKILDNCYQNKTIDDILDFAERAIYDLSENRNLSSVSYLEEMDQNIEDLINRSSGSLTGVPSGFSDLDKITLGLQPGELIILAGRPSMGKTAFALNIAKNAAKKYYTPTAVFSLEMNKERLLERFVAIETKINLQNLRQGHLTDHQKRSVYEAYHNVLKKEAPIMIDDISDLSVMEIRSKARRFFKGKEGRGLLVTDYLQIVKVEKDAERRDLAIADISNSFKQLSKELNIPVLLLSQLNRNLEQRADKRPILADLRESGSIEQDADVVAFIYRDEVYNKDENNPNRGIAEIIIGKNRNGPIGTAKLAFFKESNRFENLAREFY